MQADRRTRMVSVAVGWGLPLLLAVVILGPLLFGRGFALVGDMVFVPDQPWKPRWIGADGSVPRAVPSDALTWAAGSILPGDLVQKIVLLLTLFLAGAGAAALTREFPAAARAVAVVLAVWNPYVHERLAIGHWALLVGYAALPWAVVGARRLREGGGGAWPGVALPLALAAWTSPTGGVMATVAVLVVVAPSVRRIAGGALLALVLNLPWIVPGALNTSPLPPDPLGVDAFAARADSPWGVLGSVLGLGGIWKESVVPDPRGSWLLAGVAMGLTLVAFAALARRRDALGNSLIVLGGLGLALALLPTVSNGAASWLVTSLPGGGILRDSQKWIAWAVPGLCLGSATAADRFARWVRRHRGPSRLALAAWVVLPLLLLPTTAWGLLGKFTPHDYPAEWREARGVLEQAGAADDRVVVLPFGLYRRFDWNGGHAVLDPAPRFFPGEVITDDALEVPEGTVAGEDPLADRIRNAAADPEVLKAVLGEAGVRWVVVHTHQGRANVPVPDGTEVFDSERLRVVELEVTATATSTDQSWWIALNLTVFVVGVCFSLPIHRVRRYSRLRSAVDQSRRT